MRKISDCVRDIIHDDEIARSALERGVLNLSAFAGEIRPQIEKAVLKKVSVASIVVALARVRDDMRARRHRDPLIPHVIIKAMSVQSGLTELSYEKTVRNMSAARRMQGMHKLHEEGVLLISFGVREITIIAREEHARVIRDVFRPAKPRAALTELAAITVSFDQKYLEVPNTIFALSRLLALRRINVIEIVSTFSELTFIVRTRDVQGAFEALGGG